MKPYSLDMCQKIAKTYEAGNTSVWKVAERFQVSKSRVQEILKRKRETEKSLPHQAKGGKPSQLFGQEEQIKKINGSRTSRLHISRIL
jgi:transposase